MSRIPSASQTVGPFFNFGLTTNRELGIVAGEDVAGERIRVRFRVTDGDGVATPGDAMIELWQADAEGRYCHPADPRGCETGTFAGFGRLEVDGEGYCTFETVKPGRVAAPDGGLQAPHLNVIVFARGLLRHLHTRVYFAGDAANAEDSVLNLVPDARKRTLMARQAEGDPSLWCFEVVLQGENETVFFDV